MDTGQQKRNKYPEDLHTYAQMNFYKDAKAVQTFLPIALGNCTSVGQSN